MTNSSGLEPRGRAVLITPYEPERQKSVIAIPDDARERSAMIEQRAIVVALGPCCWEDEAQPRAKIGEKVMVSRLAGVMAKGPADGKQYRLVNDRDIFCAITAEAELSKPLTPMETRTAEQIANNDQAARLHKAKL